MKSQVVKILLGSEIVVKLSATVDLVVFEAKTKKILLRAKFLKAVFYAADLVGCF